MKKTLAGLLAAMMILTMGTTVFAAGSSNAKTTVDSAKDANGNAVTATISETVDKAVEDKVADAAKTLATADQKATVLDVFDVNCGGATNVTVTFNVAGVKASDNIKIMHYDGTKWETDCVSDIKVVDGKVSAKFASFSPIAIVRVEAATTATTPTSPATGSTLPVLPVVAFACAAGAVICGRKVKFNA